MSNAHTTAKSSFPRWAKILFGIIAIYLLAAYVVLPRFDFRQAKKHQFLLDQPTLTHTGTGLPGDPVNISIVGSDADVLRSLSKAGWFPATPLTFESSLKIAVDTVFKKPDPEAPVSSLYLLGRKEDLAFEKPVGGNPRERHHVRFWKTDKPSNGTTVWIGSAAFDIGVELSRTTGEVTHHISPDVDAERDLLLADLTAAGRVEKSQWIDGFQPTLEGKNGGGDPWRTDGRLLLITLLPPSP